MPTYEYECDSCGHRFEQLHAMSDDRVRTCPKCSSSAQRLISGGIGIISKTTGCDPSQCCDPERTDAPCGARAGECDRFTHGCMPREPG